MLAAPILWSTGHSPGLPLPPLVRATQPTILLLQKLPAVGSVFCFHKVLEGVRFRPRRKARSAPSSRCRRRMPESPAQWVGMTGGVLEVFWHFFYIKDFLFWWWWLSCCVCGGCCGGFCGCGCCCWWWCH